MRILRDALRAVVDHGRESLPHECCGILLAAGSDPPVVSRVLRADNAEQARPHRAYSVGHMAHIEAVRMEASGEASIVGYYHSHPEGGSAPSREDTERAVSGVTYLIVSFGEGPVECAAWRLDGDRLVTQPLELSA